jgi:hypothetical protein
MKLEFLKKRERNFSIVLFSFTAVLASGIFIKLTSFTVDAVKVGQYVNKVSAQSTADTNQMNSSLKASRELSEQLKQKNLFAPPTPPKMIPVNSVTGILGDEVLIDGRWYKAGDKVGDAQIVAIEPSRVKIKWDGKEQFFMPINAVVAAGPQEKGGRDNRPDRQQGNRGSTSTVTQGQNFGGFGPGGFPGFGNMSPQDMESFRQRADEMRQRFENMSDSERQQFRQQMGGRFGGGGGNRRGGGGGPGGGGPGGGPGGGGPGGGD